MSYGCLLQRSFPAQRAPGDNREGSASAGPSLRVGPRSVPSVVAGLHVGADAPPGTPGPPVGPVRPRRNGRAIVSACASSPVGPQCLPSPSLELADLELACAHPPSMIDDAAAVAAAPPLPARLGCVFVVFFESGAIAGVVVGAAGDGAVEMVDQAT